MMDLFTSWMSSDWAYALGWTFVHSIWQIAVIGFLLFITLRLIPGRSAHLRYTISTMALWLIVIMALSTFMIMLPETSGYTVTGTDSVIMMTGESLTWTESLSVWLEAKIPMMLTIWLGGIAILMIRLVFSLGWIKHLKTSAQPNNEVQAMLHHIIKKAHLKAKAQAASSTLISSPLTIGHLKPMILFPIGLINQLSLNEVEAILSHELAHIVRRDYLSNLIQSFIETLFYYHPVIWWISGMVRSERENRADDLAVSWYGDELGYAKALMKVQEIRLHSAPALTIGFASRKSAMLNRIHRILNVPYKNHNQMEKTVLLSLTSICLLAFTLSSHTSIDQEQLTPLPAPTSIVSVSATVNDSLPAKGVYKIHKKTNDQDISVEVEDGQVKALKIDGKEIQPSEYDAYDGVIDEIFGNLTSPREMKRFHFMTPSGPGAIEAYEFVFEVPPTPEMPPMPEMNFKYFFNDENIQMNDEGIQIFKILEAEGDGANARVMVFVDGDTIVQEIKLGNGFEGNMMKFGNPQMLRPYEKELMEKKYTEQQNLFDWQAKEYSNDLQRESDILRYEIRTNPMDAQPQYLELERELRALEGLGPQLYGFSPQRQSMSNELLKDGLVKPGEEVDIYLTPNKLKINGEKMPEAIQQKYLKLYEQQQGAELTGNSRVEFTIKSKQRM